MPINKYQIRNVYTLADSELYKAADKDDPEALLEGVAMAGLVGVLRQLGDLAEFAAEIFHELHEEVIATTARGHGLLIRVQQLESEIPSIERAFLSQTPCSAFFSNSGTNWHPNQQTTQNVITKGDLPRFVMDSYEECRAPPRLFLLDKFDIGGEGACLNRYTRPSVYKIEASSYEIENYETQRDKMKKKGSRWKTSQPSHAKLHQLFQEERVQISRIEPLHHVKLKKRPNTSQFDSENGKFYMNILLNSPLTLTSDESRVEILDDDNIMLSAFDSTMQSTGPTYNLEKTDFCEEAKTDSPSADVASEADNYTDALATMDLELETNIINQKTFSDANNHQKLQSQLSDSQLIAENIPENDDVIDDTCIDDPNVISENDSEVAILEEKETEPNKSDSTVLFSSGDETELNNSEIEVVTAAVFDLTVQQETELEEREKESVNSVTTVPDNVDRNNGKYLEGDTELEDHDHVDQPNGQPYLFDQVKHQSTPMFSGFSILPQLTPVQLEDIPLIPRMQWIMKKPQTPTDYGQNSHDYLPPIFLSSGIKSQHGMGSFSQISQLSSSTESSLHTEDHDHHDNSSVSSEAAVETEHTYNIFSTASNNQVFWTSSNPNSVSPVADEITNIEPMKIQGPRSPVIDAVSAHDKTELRKVSDRVITEIPTEEEHGIQGPTTNLRVAAILEKANAIRQAFARSDDESDSWSDS